MKPVFKIRNAAFCVVRDRGNRKGPTREGANYELEFYSNQGAVAYVNDVAYPISKGMMLLSKPHCRRYTVGNFSCMYIHFMCEDPEFAAEYLDPLPGSVLMTDPFRCEELMNRVIGIINGRYRSAELRLESIMLEVIAEYTDSAYLTARMPGRFRVYIPQINETIDYMKNHYLEELTARQLADRIHLSVNFFQLVFREIVGVPPAKYLRQMRVQSACRMLVNTDFSLSEIAELSGFKSAAYLTYVFKETFGVPPSEYRRENRTVL